MKEGERVERPAAMELAMELEPGAREGKERLRCAHAILDAERPRMRNTSGTMESLDTLLALTCGDIAVGESPALLAHWSGAGCRCRHGLRWLCCIEKKLR